MSLLLLNRPWCVAGVATPPVPEPYERFRPAYDLPFDELGVRLQYNPHTGLVDGTVYETDWCTRAWWQANAQTVRTIKATGGDYTLAQFTAALTDAATANDVRVLVVDSGSTVLVNAHNVAGKTGTPNWTLVCSSDWWNGTWAPTGERYLNADTEAGHLFTVQGTTTNGLLFFGSGGAGRSRWAFVGMRARRATGGITGNVGTLISIANDAAADVADVPHDHIMQWCWLDGVSYESGTHYPTNRGVRADGYKFAFLNSIATGFSYTGQDSQAICAFSSVGRIKACNAMLEATGENVLLGGASPGVWGVLSNVEMRRVYFVKRRQWHESSSIYYGDTPGGTRPGNKNSLEVKIGTNMLFEACVVENGWAIGQSGPAVLLKCVNQNNVNRPHDAGHISIQHMLQIRVGSPLSCSFYENEAVSGKHTTGMRPLHHVSVRNLLGESGTKTECDNPGTPPGTYTAARHAILFSMGGGGMDYDPAYGYGPVDIRWSTFASKHATGFNRILDVQRKLNASEPSFLTDCVFDSAAEYGVVRNSDIFSGQDAAVLAEANLTIARCAMPEALVGRYPRRSNYQSLFPAQFDARLWDLTSATVAPRSLPVNWFASREDRNWRVHPDAAFRSLGEHGAELGADIDLLETLTAGVRNPPSFIATEFV